MKNKLIVTAVVIFFIFNISFSLLLLNKINFLEYKNKKKDKDALIVQIITSIIENDKDFFIRNFNIDTDVFKWQDNISGEFYIIKESGDYYVYFPNDFVLQITLIKNIDKNKKYEYQIRIGEITGGEAKKPYDQYPKGSKYYLIGKYRVYEN